jgi:hypothetical protein
VAAGLDQVLNDVPLRSGYVDLTAGIDQGPGWWAKAEAGAHVSEHVALFGYASDSQHGGLSAGAGARFTFGL